MIIQFQIHYHYHPWVNQQNFKQLIIIVNPETTGLFSFENMAKFCNDVQNKCSISPWISPMTLHLRHNDHDGVSKHQPHSCLLNRLFRRGSKKTSKLCVTGLCVGNSPGPVNSPHKGPVRRKMFSFDDVIMCPHNGFLPERLHKPMWLIANWNPQNKH